MFRIEVQADSIPQLADQLLALGAQLSIPAEVGLTRTVASIQAAVAAADPEPVKRPRSPNKPKAETDTEAEAAVLKAQLTEQIESMAKAAPTPAAKEPEEVEAVTEPEGGVVAADLDFDKDIAPQVLDLVARKGRDAMVKVLDEFGAARASEVDTAQWPELLAKLAEAAA